MKKSKEILSILLLNIALQITLNITQVYSQGQWETTTIHPGGGSNSFVVDVDFINSNTGFVAVRVDAYIDTLIIYKTTNKGLSFTEFWSEKSSNPEFGISFKNADTGFVFNGSDVYKIWGNFQQSRVIDNSWISNKHRIKIFENGIGYCLYGTTPSTIGFCYPRIYKTTNFGDNWSIVFDSVFYSTQVILSDVDILNSNPDSVIVVGQIVRPDPLFPLGRVAVFLTSSNGFEYNYNFKKIGNVSDTIAFDFVTFLPSCKMAGKLNYIY